MSSQEENVQFVPSYTPPYTGPVSNAGPGRWVTVEGRGVYWTNDLDRVGYISVSGSETSMQDYAALNELKSRAFSQDKSTSELFEDVLEVVEDEIGLTPEITEGDLSTLSTPLDPEYTGDDQAPSAEPSTEAETPATPSTEGAEYGITVDEEGNVLEFVLVNAEGTFIRDGDQWSLIDPDGEEEDYPTYYGQEYHDVSEDALLVYETQKNNDNIPLEEMRPFIINE